MDFKTIKSELSATVIEKRSRFIATAAPVAELSQAANLLARVRAANPDARHNVFACLLLDGTRRCSDDGEPQGTAGLPTLEAISRRGICNVAVVVTRYFGGVLLGAPGLLRAYSAAATTVLDNAQTIVMQHCRIYGLVCEYSMLSRLERLLDSLECHVQEKMYTEKASMVALVPDDTDIRFHAAVTELSYGAIAPEDKGATYYSE